MKFISIILLFLTSIYCESLHFDWTELKPITQIKEYREAYPWRVEHEALDKSARVFDRSGRIIRGDVVGPMDYPFSVGLVLSFTLESGWCSGSLVSRSFVLSAGSCLVGNGLEINALLGASDITRIGEIISISNYITHEKLNAALDNDISLLKLQREAQINDYVQLVRLPNRLQKDMKFEKQKVFIAGWGSTGEANEVIPAQKLRAIQAEVITNLSCILRFPWYLTSSNLCTDVEVGTPCDGDEGSALSMVEFDGQKTQIGIFSYQYSRGCDRGWPAVFTRVTSFLDWIEKNSDVVIG